MKGMSAGEGGTEGRAGLGGGGGSLPRGGAMDSEAIIEAINALVKAGSNGCIVVASVVVNTESKCRK